MNECFAEIHLGVGMGLSSRSSNDDSKKNEIEARPVDVKNIIESRFLVVCFPIFEPVETSRSRRSARDALCVVIVQPQEDCFALTVSHGSFWKNG